MTCKPWRRYLDIYRKMFDLNAFRAWCLVSQKEGYLGFSYWDVWNDTTRLYGWESVQKNHIDNALSLSHLNHSLAILREHMSCSRRVSCRKFQ